MRSTLAHLKREYDNKVLENGEAVSNIESLLRAGIFLFPGRFTDSVLSTEVAYTGLNLVTLYHNFINAKDYLKRGVAVTSVGEPVPPPYCLNLAKWISFMQSIEVLAEVFFQGRFGERGKWSAVAIVEIIKAFLRFKLLFRTNGNIITHESLPSREGYSNANGPGVVFHKIEKKYVQKVITPPPTYNSNNSSDSPSSSKKKRKTLSDLQKEEKELKMAAQNTLMSLLPPPSPTDMLRRLLGESLYILRPLIYLISLYMYGQKSWKPWSISLASDVASWWCLARSKNKLSDIEHEVINRRMLMWWYYLVRSPFFDVMFEKQSFASTFKRIQSIPFFKVVFGSLFDYLLVYRQHYFYTSAS